MSTINNTAVASAQTNANGNGTISNVWQDVKKLLCKKFIDANRKPNFKVTEDIQLYDKTIEGQGVKEGAGKVFYVLVRDEAVESYTVHTTYKKGKDGKVEKTTVLEFKGFNPDATAVSNAGNTYSVFNSAFAEIAKEGQYLQIRGLLSPLP